MIVAIVPGAGKGKRMGNNGENKLFINIKGKPILYYTLLKLENCNLIDEIYLVLDKESLKKRQREIQNFNLKKLKKIIPGGKTRGESVYNGLKELKVDAEIVVVHDGARPFISQEKIEEVIKSAQNSDASILAIPLSDTLKEVSPDGYIEKTLPREKYVRVQTPQAFKTSILMEAYKKIGKAMEFKNTDEAYLVEKMGYKVKVVWGEYKNIKITTPFDLKLAKLIIEEDKNEVLGN